MTSEWKDTLMYRVLLIVPSDTDLPDLFEGIDYHEGWLFRSEEQANLFARQRMFEYPSIVSYEISEFSPVEEER